jgi:hypothetical protein
MRSAASSLRVLKNKVFTRFARRAGLEDSALCRAVADAERGLIDASLGGGVFKQRIARQGQGKSGGFRAVIIYRRGERAFFVYGFSKSDRANISPDELAALKELATEMLSYDDAQIKKAIEAESLIEVKCNE